MSRKASCWDNALTESQIATFKEKRVHPTTSARDAARQSLFECVEVLYNRQPGHSTLAHLTRGVSHHADHATKMMRKRAWGRTASSLPNPKQQRDPKK
jgi:putative transposase